MDHFHKAKVRSAVGLTVNAGWFMDVVNAIGVVRMATRPLHVPYVTTSVGFDQSSMESHRMIDVQEPRLTHSDLTLPVSSWLAQICREGFPKLSETSFLP
jgi:hypothetical protein